MANITPQDIHKAVIKEMYQGSKDITFAKQKLIDLWMEAFPTIRYVDDGAFWADRMKKEEQATSQVSPTDELAISFESAWGDDVNDEASLAGVAVDVSDEEPVDIMELDLNAHIAESLTRSELKRTGFRIHGGLVLTLLNPMLEEFEVKMRKGSHVKTRAQNFRVAEVKQVTKWDALEGYLYTVVNCVL